MHNAPLGDVRRRLRRATEQEFIIINLHLYMISQPSLFDQIDNTTTTTSAFPFSGLGVALITPFTAEGEIDEQALRGLVDWHIRSGVDFICLLGTTAETPCLSHDERKRVKEIVVRQNAGRLPLLMGCGGNCTKAVMSLSPL